MKRTQVATTELTAILHAERQGVVEDLGNPTLRHQDGDWFIVE